MSNFYSQHPMAPTQIISRTLACLCLCAGLVGAVQAQQVADTLRWSGRVFVDHNANGRLDGPDYGHPVLRLNAYADWNANGVQDAADTLLQQATSNQKGEFAFIWPAQARGDAPQAYLLGVETEDLSLKARKARQLYPVQAASQQDLMLGLAAAPAWCYAIGDGSSPDQLMMVNANSGHQLPLPGDLDTRYVEAMAVSPGGRSIYAVNKERLGRIPFSTGRFEPLSDTLGIGQGTEGLHAFQDIDALAFDPFTGTLYAAERRSFKRDLLVQLDTLTGKIIKNAFGPGKDYVLMEGPGVQAEIDGLAVDPSTGKLYGINNFSNVTHYDLLAEIDKRTGATHIIDTLKVDGTYLHDVEGLGFTNEGSLFATTGTSAAEGHQDVVYEISLSTAKARPLAAFGLSDDYESCDCLNAAANALTGKVFEDLNGNDQQDEGELGLADLRLYIFMDNGDRKVGRGDLLVDSVTTDAQGLYRWQAAANVDVVVQLQLEDLPVGFEYMGPHHQFALFSEGYGGMENGDNDFGVAHGSFLREWMAFSKSQRAARRRTAIASRGVELLASSEGKQEGSQPKALPQEDLTPFAFSEVPLVLPQELSIPSTKRVEVAARPERISITQTDKTFFRMKSAQGEAATEYVETELPNLLGAAVSKRLLKSFAGQATVSLKANFRPVGTYYLQFFNHAHNCMLRVKVK